MFGLKIRNICFDVLPQHKKSPPAMTQKGFTMKKENTICNQRLLNCPRGLFSMMDSYGYGFV